jgi:cell division transport system permease protein
MNVAQKRLGLWTTITYANGHLPRPGLLFSSVSTLSQVAYFGRTAAGSMVRSPFVHLIAISALSLTLVGFAVARVATAHLSALVGSLGSEVEFTVYLDPSASEENVDALAQALLSRTQGHVERISPTVALERLALQLGESGQTLRELKSNPLPWSLELKLPLASRDPATLKALAEKTRSLPFVQAVDYGEEALERLQLMAQVLRMAGLIVFALVFLTTVTVVSATLQLAIFARREEIEIQKLVGGTDRFVRMPFLIEGILQGVISSLVSVGVVWAAVWLVERRGGELLGFVLVDGRLNVSWGRLVLEQMGVGVLLGLVGSFIAVRRFLRV